MVHGLAEQDQWRAKYYAALKAFEEESRQVRGQLDTLYKLVGRLCVAAQGQGPRLDAELKRLKDAVRREAPAEQLAPMLRALVDAVQEMESGKGDARASSAELVKATAPSPASSPPPVSVRTFVDAPAQPAPAPPQAVVQAHSTASDLGANEDAPIRSDADTARIRAEMFRLLDEVAREPEMTEQARTLELELFSALNSDQLSGLIEKVGGLAVQRISKLERSRRDAEELLGQLMVQLDTLTGFMQGQTEEESQRNSSSDTLNLQISGEMRALGESVERGNDLETMRRQMRSRLESIGSHMQSFRQREQERSRAARERAEKMRVRLDEMETRTRGLQARLTDQKRLSLTDAVTKIANRAAWDQRYSTEYERWRRFRQPTCVAVWDIDRFKSINDSYGHRAGDKVLQAVAEMLSESIRTTDFVARFGGEEFAMLLPGTSLADAARLADKVRVAISEIGFHFRGEPVRVTICCGITEMRSDDSDGSVFERADKSLYEAKNGGRNKVVSG